MWDLGDPLRRLFLAALILGVCLGMIITMLLFVVF